MINHHFKEFNFQPIGQFQKNKTDDEKEVLEERDCNGEGDGIGAHGHGQTNRLFIEIIIGSIDFVETDQVSLLALCLLYAISNNKCM